MKNKETLEEAAERLYPTTIDSFTDSGIDLSERDRIIFTNGAKYQQEQDKDKDKYSEEEVKQLLCQFDMSKGRDLPTKEFDEWFDKNKKK